MSIRKIESIELIVVELPLVNSFTTSSGTVTHRTSLLVRLVAGDVQGFGECAAFAEPFYTYETVQTARYMCREFLVPQALALRNFGLAEVGAAFTSVRGHPMAKAAVENALLDALAKSIGKPLFELLGGQRKRIRSGIALGLQSGVDSLLESVEQAVSKKYHRVKIKVKPGVDLSILREVRDAFPDIPLSVDANGGYTREDTTHLTQFDRFGLEMIEQPLPRRDMVGHSALKKEMSTPICLDESIEQVADVACAKALSACDIVNIKQARVGGLLHAKAVADYCQLHRIPFWCGGMLDLGIGRAVNLHLQTLPGFDAPGDTSETIRYVEQDIVEPAVTLDEDGFIELPQGPGIGAEVLESRIDAHCLNRESF